jgi:hypothetical protein
MPLPATTQTANAMMASLLTDFIEPPPLPYTFPSHSVVQLDSPPSPSFLKPLPDNTGGLTTRQLCRSAVGELMNPLRRRTPSGSPAN